MRTSVALRLFGMLLACCGLGLLFVPATALAHARLQSSSPPDGATVAMGYSGIVIVFTEEVSADQSSAQIVGADGAPLTGATATVDRANRARLTLTTPPLSEGRYTVKWHAVTEDDNGISDGSFSFSVIALEPPGGSLVPTRAVMPDSAPSPVQPLPASGGGQSTGLSFALLLAVCLFLAAGLVARRVGRRGE